MNRTWWHRLLFRMPQALTKGAGRRPGVEQLEDRCVPSVTGFRSITGAGNNVENPAWGAAGTDLLRVSPVAYADGKSAPSTPNTINPRVLSNILNNQSNPIFSFADNNGGTNAQRLSDYAYAWGQFIDHDMDLTLDNSGQPLNIDPSGQAGDPMTLGEPFTRSQFVIDANGVRQQINAVTSYLDLSQVYGSSTIVANALRVLEPDGTRGAHLKTSPGDFLPLNNLNYFSQTELDALNMANDAHQVLDSQLFAAGDRRANENVELMSLTTLFMRNHNRIVDQLSTMNPAAFGFGAWTDQNLYQEARKLNIAEAEIITYTGYLPSILGPNALPAYTGYNDDINAGISTEFSTVGFRFGHSLLSSTVGRDNNNGTGITDVNPGGSAISLTEDFFRPDLLNNNHVTVNLVDRFGNPDPHTSSTVGEVLKGLADGLPNETDLYLIDEVRNILFGIPTGPGTDLAARDVQRARDHGIGTYNQVRTAYGLAPVTSYTQITSDPATLAALVEAYGADTPANVNKIDPFEGMLAEDHVPGADVGPTVKAILVKQFKNLRDGDRFFYLNEFFTSAELALMHQGNTLAKVIQNNTSITNLQSDVFFNRLSIEGTVFLDVAGTGFRTFTDPGIKGVVVNLLDDTGKVIATTTTDVNGHYSFTEQSAIPGTGHFTLQVVPPAGSHATTPTSRVVHLSRGDLDVDNQDFGFHF
jgi:hypothetical protein